jgi:uncharacterized protein
LEAESQDNFKAKGAVQIEFGGEKLWLLPQKALYFPEHKMLCLADIHLGKAAHFRKNGMALPSQNVSPDLLKLQDLIATYAPEKVVFLGDLFHSKANESVLEFIDFLATFSKIRFILVKGNHDIINFSNYETPNFEVVLDMYIGKILLTHEPLEDKNCFNICGHIHPGVRIRGRAKQGATLPCFYNLDRQLLIPAFGQLTGLFAMPQTSASKIYIIAGSEVVSL